jgi:hypothetical protein
MEGGCDMQAVHRAASQLGRIASLSVRRPVALHNGGVQRVRVGMRLLGGAWCG